MPKFWKRLIEKHLVADRTCSPECLGREERVLKAIDHYPTAVSNEILGRLKERPDDPAAPPEPEGGCKLDGKYRLCRHTPKQVHELAALIAAEKKGDAK